MEENVRFEETLAQLEQIVQKLESGSDSLDEMVTLYERGNDLYQKCSAKLEAFEKRAADAAGTAT